MCNGNCGKDLLTPALQTFMLALMHPQVAPRTPSPRRAPRRALDLTRLPAPRRAACELVRGADVAEEPRNDWAAYEASGLAPRPPRKALDMTREVRTEQDPFH